jgi:hypothetical protein
VWILAHTAAISAIAGGDGCFYLALSSLGQHRPAISRASGIEFSTRPKRFFSWDVKLVTSQIES